MRFLFTFIPTKYTNALQNNIPRTKDHITAKLFRMTLDTYRASDSDKSCHTE